MSDPFHSSKYSLARAKQHISDLQRQIVEFFNTHPYAEIVEIDPDTGEKVHKFKLTKPMPVALPGLAFDAINNLRSALDQAIYAVILLACGRKVRNAFFPIARTEADFENAVRGRLKDLPKEITDLVRALKPYKGGNNLLWTLNEICNTNKHAAISPVAVFTGSIDYRHAVVTGGARFMPPVWDRAKNEMEFVRLPPGGKFEAHFSCNTHIAIHDIEFIDGHPVDAILNDFSYVVEGIVMAVEAESRRLGLL